MPTSKLLSSAEQLSRLERLLAKSTNVTRYDQGSHIEAGTIVHALSDMERSFHELFERILPKLVEGDPSAAQVDEVLWEIRDELRHIVYHIRDPKTFSDVLE